MFTLPVALRPATPARALSAFAALSSAALLLAPAALSAQALHAPARLELLQAPLTLATPAGTGTAALNLAPAPASSSADELASLDLPDSPAQQADTPLEHKGGFSPLGKEGGISGNRAPQATDITVPPHTVAPHQTAKDKLVGSVYDSISPFTFVGELISAGYTQLTDGRPNYAEGGSTGQQFGQRLGAAVARGTSQNLFSEGVLAAALHEDPRYYQMGDGNGFFKRLFYAGTRPLVTRTDGGRQTPNLALLGGYLGAAELTPVYYPPLNQSQSEVLATYGSSLGGAALGYVVAEFLPDVLSGLHIKKFSHF